MTAYLAGVGSYLPSRVVPNEAIATLLGIDADWIEKRKGIVKRYLADSEVGTEHMAASAAREALAQSRVMPGDVGLVVVASSFHPPFPAASIAHALKRSLGLTRAHAVDISTPLVGFMDALSLGQAAAATPGASAVLVVGSEGFSEATRLKDRRICHMLSDGAGALVLTSSKGFARLGDVSYAERESAPAESLQTCEQDSLLLPRVSPGVFLETLLQMLESSAILPSSRAKGSVHVITQQIAEAQLAGGLPAGVRIYNPLADTGLLLGASLPLMLNDLIRNRGAVAGDHVLLFATDGRSTWSSCALELQSLPDLAAPLGDRRQPHPEGGAERSVQELDRQEMERLVAQEVRAASPTGASLVAVGLKMELAGGAGREVHHGAEQEAVSILRRHSRSSDALFRLRDTLCFALLLRDVHGEDAEGLCRRLKRVFENLDPSGQFEFQVDVRFFVPGAGIAPEELAPALMAHLAG